MDAYVHDTKKFPPEHMFFVLSIVFTVCAVALMAYAYQAGMDSGLKIGYKTGNIYGIQDGVDYAIHEKIYSKFECGMLDGYDTIIYGFSDGKWSNTSNMSALKQPIFICQNETCVLDRWNSRVALKDVCQEMPIYRIMVSSKY